jgi:hypothetical protein
MVFTNTPIGYLRDAEVAGPPSPPEVMEVPVPAMVLIVGGDIELSTLRIFFEFKSAMIRFPTVSKHKCCRLVENWAEVAAPPSPFNAVETVAFFPFPAKGYIDPSRVIFRMLKDN